MQAIKNYYVWIIIAVVIVAALGFDYVYVGKLQARAQNDHKQVESQVNSFTRFISKMSREVPTPADMLVGGEYLQEIQAEGGKAARIWGEYARFFDKGIVGSEVIYTESSADKNGKVVPTLVFTDYLYSRYLNTMISVEKATESKMLPAWAKMLAQSSYATNPKFDKESAKAEGETSSKRVSAEMAHFFSPITFVPFMLSDKFPEEQERIIAWRRYLVFQDIMERVVKNTYAEVSREVVAFERKPEDYDETIPLKTEINRGKGERFIENMSVLSVEPILVGDSVIQLPDGEGFEGGSAGSKRSGDDDESTTVTGVVDRVGVVGSKMLSHDVFEVKIEMIAHAKVLDLFLREMSNSQDIYYIPMGYSVKRYSDVETGGDYKLPRGLDYIEPSVSAVYAESPANPVSKITGLEREAPLSATMTFHVYRPRVTGSFNPLVAVEEQE